MSENIIISGGTKEEKYKSLLPQIEALIKEEDDLIANMANVSAALKFSLHFFWVGFYLIKNEQLILGPFQGPVACTRINKGKGVCGSSWQKEETIIVDDVDTFPGHIACSSLSKSEIVIPIFNSKKQCVGVLDVDSEQYATFDNIDAVYLQQIVAMLNF